MSRNYKIINDTVHGSVRVDEPFLELLSSPEMAKLQNIRQLGLAYLVFPGANHTRLEHSIGTYHVAGQMSKALGLDGDEDLLVRCAALLHDIGHGPFSHTLEYLFHSSRGFDHMGLTKDLITGREMEVERTGEFSTSRTIADILASAGVEPEKVAALVTGSGIDNSQSTMDTFAVQNEQGFFNGRRYLGQIIHSTCDADQVDYLLRDGHYTGVTHGSVDMNRLMNTMELMNNDLIISKRGIEAVEGMLVSRSLMYSSVYFHRTVRLAEVMLSHAVETAPEGDLGRVATMTDSELLSYLEGIGGYPALTVKRLKYRQLFKVAYSIPVSELGDDRSFMVYLADLRNRRRIEEELCRKAGVENGSILLDTPQAELKISEPRMKMIDIGVRQGDSIVPFSRCSPLARALQVREVPDWAMVVYTEKRIRDDVGRLARKLIPEIEKEVKE